MGLVTRAQVGHPWTRVWITTQTQDQTLLRLSAPSPIIMIMSSYRPFTNTPIAPQLYRRLELRRQKQALRMRTISETGGAYWNSQKMDEAPSTNKRLITAFVSFGMCCGRKRPPHDVRHATIGSMTTNNWDWQEHRPRASFP